MAELVPLTSISIPNLVNFYRKDMNEELIEKIKSHPEWNEIWDGELLQNSSYAIINFFTYLLSKVKESNNRLVKENFFVAADDPQSIVNGLLAYGLSVPQNLGSKVQIQGLVATPDYIYKQFIIPAATQLFATDLEGNQISFEIYNTFENGNIDYNSDIIIEPNTDGTQKTSFTVQAFAGTTQSKTIELPTYDYEKFTIDLETSDIIQDSIEVVFDENGLKETKLIETDNFTINKVYNSHFTLNNSTGIPMYKVAYTTSGNASLVFGTRTFGGYFPSNIISSVPAKTLTIRYRVGGGKSSNINSYSINQTLAIPIVEGFRDLNVLFRNLTNASGGRDRSDIFEEQFYAPYRFGKDKAIVDERDVVYELSGTLVKHKVDTPKYSEVDNTVNILHYNNYIVPNRNFETFEFPTPLSTDTLETYNQKFLEDLNVFCNVDKIHDGIVEDEIVNTFQSENFDYTLQMTNPLNGSIVMYAYNNDGIENDRMTFPYNYSGTVNLNGGFTNHAVATSTPLGAVRLPNGIGKLKLIFDRGDGIQGIGEILEIEIQSGINYNVDLDGKATALAAAINDAIKNSTNRYIATFPDYTFAFIDSNKKLNIASPITGNNSRVQIIDDGTASLMNSYIGLTAGINIPQIGTGIVFSTDSNYIATTSTINIAINKDSFPVTVSKTDGIPTEWPNNSSKLGPIVSFILLDEFGKRYIPQIGTQITCNLYDNLINPEIISSVITFNSIIDSTVNSGSVDNYNLLSQLNSYINFDYTTSTISFRLADNTGSGVVDLDISAVLGSTEIKVINPSTSIIYPRVSIEGENFSTGTIVSSIDLINKQITISNQAATNKINDIIRIKPNFFGYILEDTSSFRLIPTLTNIPTNSNILNSNLPSATKITSYNSNNKTLILTQNATATQKNLDFEINFQYPILSVLTSSNVLKTNEPITVFKSGMFVNTPNDSVSYGSITDVLTSTKQIKVSNASVVNQKNQLLKISTGNIFCEAEGGSNVIKVYGTTTQNKIFQGQIAKTSSSHFPTNTTVVSRSAGLVTLSNVSAVSTTPTTVSGVTITASEALDTITFTNHGLESGNKIMFKTGVSGITIETNGTTEIVTFTGHNLATGNKIIFKTEAIEVTGITKDTTYYVNVLSPDTFKLCTTFSDAVSGINFLNLITGTVPNNTIEKASGIEAIGVLENIDYYIYKNSANTFKLCTTFSDAISGINTLSLNNGTIPNNTIQKTTGNVVSLDFIFYSVFDLSNSLNNPDINKTLNLSQTNIFFEGMKLETSGISSNTYITAVGETSITISQLPTVENTNLTTTCKIFINGDTTSGLNTVLVNPTQYLQVGMKVESDFFDPETEITNISNDIVTLSNPISSSLIYEKLTFYETYRATQKKGNSVLTIDPFAKLRTGMTITSDTSFAGTAQILTINSSTNSLTVDIPSTSTVKEEASLTDYYSYDTFINTIYSPGSIRIESSLTAKTYKYITVDYKPNPYRNEGEALGFLDILRAERKKMIGIEPLLKKVNFIPTGVDVSISVRPGYSKNNVVNGTKQIIENYFGYSNNSYFLDIGSGFPINRMRSLLNDDSLNVGIDVATINSPTTIIDSTNTAYYFVLPDFIIDNLVLLEQEYPQIMGISNLYSIKIQVE